MHTVTEPKCRCGNTYTSNMSEYVFLKAAGVLLGKAVSRTCSRPPLGHGMSPYQEIKSHHSLYRALPPCAGVTFPVIG